MGVHERRWWYRRDPAHQRRWHDRLSSITRLERLLRLDSWSPVGAVKDRRDAVTRELTSLRKVLERTPSRAGRRPRVIDIRWRWP